MHKEFIPGDPVMVEPTKFKSRADLAETMGVSPEVAATLLPPKSYVGTVDDYMGPQRGKSVVVKWDHLGDTGYMFFQDELRSGG